MDHDVRAISGSKVSKADKYRLTARRACAWACVAAGVGKYGFSRSAAQWQHDPAASFGVHPFYAHARFGAQLQITVATRRIESELIDWAQAQGRVHHTADYFLARGSWAKLTKPVRQLAVSQEAAELLEYGMDYRRTPSYAKLCEATQRRPKVRQHRTLVSTQDIDRYFEGFVGLFRSIEKEGFRQMGRVKRLPSWHRGARLSIAIDAQGQPMKLPGAKHRLAIAHTLGIEQISADIGMIHMANLTDDGVSGLSLEKIIERRIPALSAAVSAQ